MKPKARSAPRPRGDDSQVDLAGARGPRDKVFGEGEPKDPNLVELRELILGKGRAREISRAAEQVLDESNRVSALQKDLPEALQKANDSSGAEIDRLAASLQPSVQRALEQSVENHPKEVSRMLAPIVGNAAIGYLSTAMQALSASLYQRVYELTSPSMLRWRFQCYLKGIPLKEFLDEKFGCRVAELHVFNRDEGQLIGSAVNEGGTEDLFLNPEFVSENAKTLEIHLREKASRESGTLPQLQGGSPLHLLEGDLTLIAVIDGVVTQDLVHELQSILQSVEADLSSGSLEPEAVAESLRVEMPRLQACRETKPTKRGGKAGPALLFGTPVICLLGFLAFRSHHWNGFVEAMDAEPGFHLTSVEGGWISKVVRGYRDPLAISESDFLEKNDPPSFNVELRLAPVPLEEEPFRTQRREEEKKSATALETNLRGSLQGLMEKEMQGAQARLIESSQTVASEKIKDAKEAENRRALDLLRAELGLPNSLHFQINDQVLKAEGTLGGEQLRELRSRALQLGAVSQVDLKSVINSTEVRIDELVQEISSKAIPFVSGKPALTPAGHEQLQGSVEKLKVLKGLLESENRSYQIRIHCIPLHGKNPTANAIVVSERSVAVESYLEAETNLMDQFEFLPPRIDEHPVASETKRGVYLDLVEETVEE